MIFSYICNWSTSLVMQRYKIIIILILGILLPVYAASACTPHYKVPDPVSGGNNGGGDNGADSEADLDDASDEDDAPCFLPAAS